MDPWILLLRAAVCGIGVLLFLSITARDIRRVCEALAREEQSAEAQAADVLLAQAMPQSDA